MCCDIHRDVMIYGLGEPMRYNVSVLPLMIYHCFAMDNRTKSKRLGAVAVTEYGIWLKQSVKFFLLAFYSSLLTFV